MDGPAQSWANEDEIRFVGISTASHDGVEMYLGITAGRMFAGVLQP